MKDGILHEFLDSLISLLWDVLRRSMNPKRDQLVALYQRLRSCRATLKHGWDEKFRGRVEFLIRDAGTLICLLHQASVEIDLTQLSDLIQRFDISLGVEAQSSLPQAPPCLDGLMKGSREQRVLHICGMADLGKTTLALQLYNHPSVVHHFHVRAWCTISQVLDRKKVLLQLLTQTSEPGGTDPLSMTEYDLASKLYRSLKGRRYLIVLDDVWTAEVWGMLQASLPDDSNQSRIILTSRIHHIVPRDLLIDGGPYMLRLRTDDECLNILGHKLFSESNRDAELLEFGRKCMGLPLIATVVAGILANQRVEVWGEIMGALSVSGVSPEERCNTALDLSFKHLPIELRVCFIYFGVFQEDQDISVTRLVQLWMGEGFLGQDQVAREYLQKLIDRSLVTVVQTRSIGGAKICKIHDLLHDFCRKKAKQHNHFHLLLQRHDQLFNFNEPSDLQRLCIHSDPLHFKESRLFCPLARSILFFSAPESSHESCLFDMSFIIQIYQLLQVINMEQIPMSSGLPSDICLLTRLKFLSVQIIVCDIPTSIGNLSNLETFIGDFWSGDAIYFPESFWNLRNLKHLYIRNSRRGGYGFHFPSENLDNSPNLLNLETLSGVVFRSDSIMEEQMMKFPNIRKLKCRIQPGGSIVVPEFLSRLELFTIQGSGKTNLQIAPTGSLKKLTLNGFYVSREEIAAIGMFPVLEVLKLEKTTFLGGILVIEEGEFSELRVLHLEDIYSLQRWTDPDSYSDYDVLPCLEKLTFSRCRGLVEIPSSLQTSPIEEVQVYGCSRTLRNLVRDLVQVHSEYGNLVNVDIRL